MNKNRGQGSGFRVQGTQNSAIRIPQSEFRNPKSAFSIETIVKIITYLVGMLGFIAVFRHIDVFFNIAFLSLFSLSLYFEYSKKFYIPRWVLNSLSLLVIFFSFYRFKLSDLVTQIIEALLILLAIKFIEDKKFRDYMQIYAIVLFLLAGLGLLSLDITFIVYLLILVFLLTTSIVLLTYYSQDPNLYFTKQTVIKIVLKSMYIPLVAIPVAVLMFVILPRTQYPIFHFINRADKAKTGFTDNVRLGVVSDIQEDSSAILRANMEKIEDNALYWRGIVLDYFDGTSWKSSTKDVTSMSFPSSSKGKSVRQIIYLEPYENRYLFALDKPVYIFYRGARKYDDFTFISTGYIDKRIRYEAVSIITDTISESKIEESKYLQMPDNLSPEIAKLVKRITIHKDETKNMQSIYAFLNDGTYKYSLKNLPVTKNPLEDFLFLSKFGNCEYFASAFTIMLRLAGIPSRVVGGYKGGYYNDLGGYYLVPQKNAHVWVEVYIREKGWVRMDPTPATIDHFASLMKGDIFFRLSVLLDAVNYYWYAMIINYNFEKQLSIFYSIKSSIKKPNFKFSFNKVDIAKYLVIVLSLAGIVFAIRAAVRFDNSKEKKILSLFQKVIAKHGYKKTKTQGLEEFVMQMPDEKIRQSSYAFVREFERLYFKDKQLSPDDIKKLKYLIKSIR
ncbi:MAG: transglutaminaseTgpA domain-containing protein [Proteobacteria bacterium]|nr:transglutaminaseTgpA domain-containing protein [Pseudomonadota bacterium]